MVLTLFPDFINVTRELSESERGQLLLAVMEYLNGEEPANLTGAAKIAFIVLKTQAERDEKSRKEYAQTQSENGKKGGRPKTEKSDGFSAKANESEKSDGFSAKAKKATGFSEKPKKLEVEVELEQELEVHNNPPKPPESDLDAFEGQLREVVEEWLRYKHERREDYKPVGRKSLLSQIASNAKEYGDEAVADVIRESMSSGYKGIVFDRLARPTYRKADKPSRDAEMDDLVAEFMRDRGKG